MLHLTDDSLAILAEANRDEADAAAWEWERERLDWLESLAVQFVASMQAEGIADPLATPVTLAAALCDLFTLAGADMTVAIAERIG